MLLNFLNITKKHEKIRNLFLRHFSKILKN